MTKTTIGIIGCGNISEAYLKGAARSDLIEIKAVADINAEAAARRAKAYGIEPMPVDRLLADGDIEIVINLTVPLAHARVSTSIIAAGKHVYSEKPLAATLADGRAIAAAAKAAGVRLGCAPDTFLGAGHQTCRAAIDAGRIGKIIGGAACFWSHGMEHWHPDPTFFFKPGGGPVLDMAPYYLTTLINLIGPVLKVTSVASRGSDVRTVTSEGPMTGKIIAVDVPTTVNAALMLENGANVALTTSWDVWQSERLPFELYGSDGSILVPDPNFFGGSPKVSDGEGGWQSLDIGGFAYGLPNRKDGRGRDVADYRIIGLLDMAAAIHADRPHRASGAMALHVLEVMDALSRSSEEGRHIAIESRPERPAPLSKGDGEAVFS
ncbi:MAG: Gfo/Idh/MocA family oxidoreductase [Pseudomonadota bacterium]